MFIDRLNAVRKALGLAPLRSYMFSVPGNLHSALDYIDTRVEYRINHFYTSRYPITHPQVPAYKTGVERGVYVGTRLARIEKVLKMNTPATYFWLGADAEDTPQ